MTDREYLEEMILLTTRLTDACNNFGIRSPEYNAVLIDIAAGAARFNLSRRRRHWFRVAVIVFLFGLLGLLVVDILFWF